MGLIPYRISLYIPSPFLKNKSLLIVKFLKVKKVLKILSFLFKLSILYKVPGTLFHNFANCKPFVFGQHWVPSSCNFSLLSFQFHELNHKMY